MQGIASNARLDWLTSLRFFAALLVVGNRSTREPAQVPGVSQLLTMGTSGVTFFFALSRFVLTWSHRENDSARSFYRRRFARIYPMHAATWVLAFPVLILAQQEISALQAGSDLLLLQAWVPDSTVYFGMNAPSWSLSNEFLFYVLFPLVIPVLVKANTRALTRLLVILLPANVALTVTVGLLTGDAEMNHYLFYVLPVYGFVAFFAGAVVAKLVKDGARVRLSLRAAVVLALFAYLVVWFCSRRVPVLGHGAEDSVLLPCILALLAAAAAADVRRERGFLTRPTFVKLGEWSFALYMTHWLLLTAVVSVLPGLGTFPLVVRVVANITSVVAAVALAAAAYYGVERPLERRLRGTKPRPEMIAAEPPGF